MPNTAKLKRWFTGKFNIGRTLRESFDFVSSLVTHDGSGSQEKHQIRFAVNSLVHYILLKDGRISLERRDVCRRLWEERFSHAEAEARLQELISMSPASIDEVVEILQTVPDSQKISIIEFLIALSVELGDDAGEIQTIFGFAEKFKLEVSELNESYLKLKEENRKRKLLVSSGWGVLVAVGVILLFIITAKLLQSVIFGLIIGCVLLPLEKFIERQLRRRRGFFYLLCAAVLFIFRPLKKLQQLLTRKDRDLPRILRVNAGQRADMSILRQAVGMTAFVTLVLLTAVGFGISGLTGHYMRNFRDAQSSGIRRSLDRNSMLVSFEKKLTVWRDQVENYPPVHRALGFVSRAIKNPETRARVGGEIIKRSGGMLKITVDLFGAVTGFFANLLLTVFFALLFLFKLAQFCRDDDSDRSKSEYVVRMVFNGIWLPGADESVISEARRIIEGVFFRLRVWMKGYLTLVIVDSSVYTTIFFFMGLPLFWLLGIIAGCGILLPYLGPVISCFITLIVTVAFGGASSSLLLGIIIAYLIYNGVIEQFILYPAVIGEALGLSTLETIIVVLLGAIFAGIPGMILALPAASVAKYIIPQLYRNFIRPSRKAEEV